MTDCPHGLPARRCPTCNPRPKLIIEAEAFTEGARSRDPEVSALRNSLAQAVAALAEEEAAHQIVEAASVGAHALLAEAETEIERLRGVIAFEHTQHRNLHETHMAAGAELEAELGQRLRELDTWKAAHAERGAQLDAANAELADLSTLHLAEVERLCALVERGIDAGARNDGDAIDRIRREAGLA